MVPTAIGADNERTTETPVIKPLRETLSSESASLAHRFRALFSLKHYASLKPPTEDTLPAIHAIAAAFPTPSALLKHELAYCLGQTRHPAAVPILRDRLSDSNEIAICRHEAAEALAALDDIGSILLLKKYRDDEGEERVVRETCEIAVARLEWLRSAERWQESLKASDFASIDPAPPLPQAREPPSIPVLERTLLDTTLPLFLRYRAMFSLRNLASPPDLPTAVPAVHSLAKGLQDSSALFRHEVAFVFGQLSHPASIPSLFETLRNQKEVGMVRHEAAEALGSLGDQAGVDDMLKQFLEDEEDVVRESIVVALDMAEFERNGDVEYAELPNSDNASGDAVAV
ncbi:MAG: deoxyhypusine hydroxylase [Phylliscum demangeonii]|nr:MAG: deoxyhypusine hydroxylase [Phylliscum demangeonii]